MLFLKHTQLLADVLTISRVFIGISFIVLGVGWGAEFISTAILFMLLAWLTDMLDGPLARLDIDHPQTWIGSHDSEADLIVSLGITGYLVLSGYFTIWLGGTLLLLIPGLWFFHSQQLAWPFYAIPYVSLIFISLKADPIYGQIALVVLILIGIIYRERLRSRYVPEFLQTLKNLFLQEKKDTNLNS